MKTSLGEETRDATFYTAFGYAQNSRNFLVCQLCSYQSHNFVFTSSEARNRAPYLMTQPVSGHVLRDPRQAFCNVPHRPDEQPLAVYFADDAKDALELPAEALGFGARFRQDDRFHARRLPPRVPEEGEEVAIHRVEDTDVEVVHRTSQVQVALAGKQVCVVCRRASVANEQPHENIAVPVHWTPPR